MRARGRRHEQEGRGVGKSSSHEKPGEEEVSIHGLREWAIRPGLTEVSTRREATARARLELSRSVTGEASRAGRDDLHVQQNQLVAVADQWAQRAQKVT